jgi:hypothetical protein
MVLNALCFAGQPELLLRGRQLARAVPLELDPHRVTVDANPKIGRAGGRLRSGMSGVPAKWDFAPIAVL